MIVPQRGFHLGNWVGNFFGSDFFLAMGKVLLVLHSVLEGCLVMTVMSIYSITCTIS